MQSLALRRQILNGAARATATRLPAQTTRPYSGSAPTVTDASFWKSLVPKPFRSKPADPFAANKKQPSRSKEWNPATFYIVIFLLIGSMSIQMISLRKSFEAFMRQSDVRIGLLREVVERIQKGETVDVERMLGTGDAAKERDWEEVLKEIEREDTMKNPRKQERRKTADAAQTKAPDATVKTESTQPPPASSRPPSTASFF